MAEEKDDNNLGTPDELTPTTEEQEGMSSEASGENHSIPSDATDRPDAPEENDGGRDLDFILDIPLRISVELGRTQMLVNDLLRLG